MFYKSVENGIIVSINTIGVGKEISENEYNSIVEKIAAKPNDENAMFQLNENMNWVRIDLPPEPITPDEEASVEDYESVLAEVGI